MKALPTINQAFIIKTKSGFTSNNFINPYHYIAHPHER